MLRNGKYTYDELHKIAQEKIDSLQYLLKDNYTNITTNSNNNSKNYNKVLTQKEVPLDAVEWTRDFLYKIRMKNIKGN